MDRAELDRLVRRDDASKGAIGARLAIARTAIGLTQEVLAEEIGVTKAAISNYEHGTSFVSAACMVWFYRNQDIDFNFFFVGDYAGMPIGTVEKIFASASKRAGRGSG